MLNLRELRFKGIGRFVEEQIVKFDELGNLVQVDGNNKNTGGSSGSGKTTVFNAVDYLLGLNDTPVTVLQSRLTKDGINVVGVFEWDGKDVELIRGKGKLSISIDGSTMEGSNKLVEEKIDEMIGMSRDLFRPILHKRQKEGGFFLAMTPSKTHEFLTSCLNLTEYKIKVDAIDKIYKDLSTKKVSTESALNAARSGLSATQDAILALGLAPVKDMHQEVVLSLKQKYDISADKLAEAQSVFKQKYEDLQANKPARIPRPALDHTEFDNSLIQVKADERSAAEIRLIEIAQEEKSRQAKIKQAMTEMQMEMNTLSNHYTDALKAKEEALSIASEIKKIRASICPTCEQNWVTDAAFVKETSLLEKLAHCRALIDKGSSAHAAGVEIKMKMNLLEKELSEQISPEIEILKTKSAECARIIKTENEKRHAYSENQKALNGALISDWDRNQKALDDKHTGLVQDLREAEEQSLNHLRGQTEVDRRTFEIAAGKLSAFEQANSRYTSSLTTLKAQEQSYLSKIDQLSSELTQVDTQTLIAEATKTLIKSFMSCSFDDALEQIGDVATRIIRSIPNMANSTIQFQGLRETQAGKVKEEVNAVISMDGEEGIDIRSLSGGERSSADLAIDLAVIELIENRSNKGINIFILDEPFTGLDTVSIEMVLEVLKNSNINKKLIIVDHNSEVKQMVESCILVTREGTTSSVAY